MSELFKGKLTSDEVDTFIKGVYIFGPEQHHEFILLAADHLTWPDAFAIAAGCAAVVGLFWAITR